MDEYVLPKFEVKLDVKPASAADRFLTVRVDAKYTFGGAVQGRATITVSRPQNIWWGGPVLVRPVLADAAVDGAIIAPSPGPQSDGGVKAVKTIDIDGTGSAQFDLVNDLKETFSDSQRQYNVEAIVVETQTRECREIERK